MKESSADSDTAIAPSGANISKGPIVTSQQSIIKPVSTTDHLSKPAAEIKDVAKPPSKISENIVPKLPSHKKNVSFDLPPATDESNDAKHISKTSTKDVANKVEDTPGDSEDTGSVAGGREEQFCFCRGEEYGLMIQCESCSEW